jgi:hypothetical protein
MWNGVSGQCDQVRIEIKAYGLKGKKMPLFTNDVIIYTENP